MLLLTVHAQVMITLDTPVNITFSGTLTGVSTGAFTASGFTTAPGSGKLDSDAWNITGFSDGDLNYGGSVSTGDLARGTVTMLNPVSDVGATIGGIYSYTGSPFSISNPAMLIQPTDADCTPGNITLKVVNNHPTETIYLLDIAYDLWVRNNTSSSSKISFSWSEDDVSYTSISSLDYISTASSSSAGIVSAGTHAYTIIGCDVTPGEFMYLRWTVSDVSGTGERDEFYFDDMSVTATNLLPVELISLYAVQEAEVITLHWETASEESASYFQVEKAASATNSFEPIAVVAAENNTNGSVYRFTDEYPMSGVQYYRLKMIDASGSFSYSKTTAAIFEVDNILLLFPAPATDVLTIQCNGQLPFTVTLYNTEGIIVSGKTTISHSSATITVGHLPAGIYTAYIYTSDGKMIAHTFVKL
jgi:hypothetical protein